MKKNVRSEVQFARTYPYYLKLGGKPVSSEQAFSFSVTVSAQKKINPMTGMSVDLVQLDQIAKKVLKTKTFKTGEVTAILKKLVSEIQKSLEVKNTKLIRAEFEESRGSAYVFVGRDTFFMRQDFAQDDDGDLFKIKSFFNMKNNLVRLNLINLKTTVEEIIIFK